MTRDRDIGDNRRSMRLYEPRRLARIRLIPALVAVLLLGGCASGVKPWERGLLAEPAMQLNEKVSDKLARQYYFSREAARGGQSFGGTGCGCN